MKGDFQLPLFLGKMAAYPISCKLDSSNTTRKTSFEWTNSTNPTASFLFKATPYTLVLNIDLPGPLNHFISPSVHTTERVVEQPTHTAALYPIIVHFHTINRIWKASVTAFSDYIFIITMYSRYVVYILDIYYLILCVRHVGITLHNKTIQIYNCFVIISYSFYKPETTRL